MPSAMELAAASAALRRAGHAAWLPALRPAPPDPDSIRLPPVYHLWAAKPRGRPRRPVGKISHVTVMTHFYCAVCARRGCAYFNDAIRFQDCVLDLVEHCRSHGLEPFIPSHGVKPKL